MYADDTQIYIESNQEWKPVLHILATGCIQKLQLNENKTDLVMITPSQQAGKIVIESVQVGNCDIKPTSCAHNFGVTLDQHMTIKHHISSLSKSC